MDADERQAEARSLVAELRRLRSPEHRGTFVNHIGPNVTGRRIAVIEARLEVLARDGSTPRALGIDGP